MVRKSLAAFLAGFAVLVSCATQRPVSARPYSYTEAARVFQDLSLQQRVFLQVLMTAAGYWNGIPNEDFSTRLFRSIQDFEDRNGFAATGVLDGPQIAKLIVQGGSQLKFYGFRKVSHPSRNHAIWIPLGLGLKVKETKGGLHYDDPQNRLVIDFLTFPNTDIVDDYRRFMGRLLQSGHDIHYDKLNKDGWFAVSSTSAGGVDHYYRYHRDGSNITGFSLTWNNANGNINAERIAILMSASLSADMQGSPFIDPLFPDPPEQEATARPGRPAEKPAPDAAPQGPVRYSSGTGFFVDQDGSFVTNAHVIEGCREINVKIDDGSVVRARLAATDSENDLALLKLPKTPKKAVTLRTSIRLGEGIETFGFPHSDLLSSSGNFTLGNITALNGLKDDSRFLQISAPVQAGNSGGPLLDQSGNLVGIVSAKLNAIKMAMADGDLPQNVNFAIKASLLASFLDTNRVSATIGTILPKPLDPADIADQARAVSGFILCH